MNYSKQRQQILNYIKESDIHPTVEEVYNGVKSIMPKISLGTVYRNLDVLFNMGLINKVVNRFGTDRYDAVMDRHYHVECIKCGDIKNIFIEKLSDIDDIAKESSGDEILTHNLIFNSICRKCKNCSKFNECKKNKEKGECINDNN